MTPPRSLPLLAAAALGLAPAGMALTPAAAAALPPAARATSLRAAPGARASVTAVSVAPAATGAAVTVHLDREVDVQHFVLDAPRRVVLDLGGATLLAGAPRYDGAARGGVTNVRASQYRAGVVRVVVELDGARKYRVERTAEGVQVVVEGGAGTFAAWRGGTAAAVAAPPEAPAPESAPDAAGVAPSAATPSAAPEAAAADPRPTPRAPRRAARRSARPAADQAAPRDEAAPRRAAGAPRLTVTYQEADVRDVIAAFAAFSGRTIIAGRDVSGTVTAEIKDQPWDVALRALLGAQGLAATEDRHGIITVDSWRNLATTRAVEPMTTQIVSVNYAKAASLPQSRVSSDCTMGSSAPAFA